MKYALTARENIGLGDISRVDDNEAIEQAARLSSAQAVIDGLPSGFDTMLGKEFAGGQEISEGQWQKLAIARVYLRDTDILVLDEPASALDALAELEVYRRFLVLSEGKTVLLISHRLGSARLADRDRLSPSRSDRGARDPRGVDRLGRVVRRVVPDAGRVVPMIQSYLWSHRRRDDDSFRGRWRNLPRLVKLLWEVGPERARDYRRVLGA